MVDFTELIKTFVILVAIIDPIGNIPVYISLTVNKADAEHESKMNRSFSPGLTLKPIRPVAPAAHEGA